MKPSWAKAEGIIIGSIVLLLLGLLAYSTLVPAKESGARSPETVCHSQLKQLATSTAIYQADHDDNFPMARWDLAIFPYTKNPMLLDCPEVARLGRHFGYAMNLGIAGVSGATMKSPGTTVMLFETVTLRPGIFQDSARDVAVRHGGESFVAYCDTSVRSVQKGERL